MYMLPVPPNSAGADESDCCVNGLGLVLFRFCILTLVPKPDGKGAGNGDIRPASGANVLAFGARDMLVFKLILRPPALEADMAREDGNGDCGLADRLLYGFVGGLVRLPEPGADVSGAMLEGEVYCI